ncbi:MAG TPA: bifunctional 5,10-methylenetetrahydrofolate dehydrogenase/5,10-methenyltetrahydrofolate cyclohydrolase, partial [Longimicrobiales bacterium]|nr:bifunctional 5,10-methylenetetrahydrofolate dehydrogenase/5,10-methenyltetrahydrofolate cyclohydrolase [Longimicrobiales bacterium]
MTTGTRLDGRELARRLRRDVAARLEAMASQGVALPVPTLGLVAVDVHPGTRRFVALKERAFHGAGLEVRTRILPSDADTGAVTDALAGLAADPAIHGLFLQYPLPSTVDVRACVAAIPLAKDVDASGPAAEALLREGRPRHVPGTPAAILRLLDASGADLIARGVTLVAVEGAVGEGTAALLRHRGVPVRVVRPDAPDVAAAVGEASVLVTSAGRPGAVSGRWIGDGAVVVDAGYHHPGGAGDIVPAPDSARLDAWAPPRGGVGPLTVAQLM